MCRVTIIKSFVMSYFVVSVGKNIYKGRYNVVPINLGIGREDLKQWIINQVILYIELNIGKGKNREDSFMPTKNIFFDILKMTIF